MKTQTAWIMAITVLSYSFNCLAAQPDTASTGELQRSTNSASFDPSIWENETNGFRLSLVFHKAQYKHGEAIKAELTLKNVSNEVKHADIAGQIEDFEFIILDAKGRGVPLTEDGEKRKKQTRMESSFHLALEPGRELNASYRINSLWEMSAPGKYRVVVTRNTSYENWLELRRQGKALAELGFTVCSNPVEIEVLAK
ncbi:MAG TPA: hypothetical protein VK327_18375 [Candidatus Paceibacterota bacterium]|nr:hypothetical protein [Candidatus Paceibacterota bacterium]